MHVYFVLSFGKSKEEDEHMNMLFRSFVSRTTHTHIDCIDACFRSPRKEERTPSDIYP